MHSPRMADYPWSSLRHYAKGNPPSWQSMERVLEAFELSKGRRGRTSYLGWLEAMATVHGGAIHEEAMEPLRRGWHLNSRSPVNLQFVYTQLLTKTFGILRLNPRNLHPCFRGFPILKRIP